MPAQFVGLKNYVDLLNPVLPGMPYKIPLYVILAVFLELIIGLVWPSYESGLVFRPVVRTLFIPILYHQSW